MVLRQGMVLALVGLAVGLVASIAAGMLLAAAFPQGGQERTDVPALMIVALTVLVVTFIATYIPATRAASIHPVQALRHD
jgi:ABC-type antimicrobial peptide transport system permease subunit